MKHLTTLTLALLLWMTTTVAFANEEKNHICFHRVDANGDGQITIHEFEIVYGKNSDLFKKVDMDENGSLTHDEYHEALGHGTL